MQKPAFIKDKIYHIYNRGVEKRNIFINDKDRYRFIHCLFEFNDEASADNLFYYFNRKNSEVELQYLKPQRKPRKLLVNILAFCLMPNHYHFLLQPLREGGVVRLMQKLGTGYTNYFNKKYGRVGSLFQGRFKAVLVNENSHLLHLPYYIHCNPLDLKFPEWRNYGSSTSLDWGEAVKFLEKYRWSSYLDYIGKKNFPSVTQRGFLTELLGGPEQYKEDMIKWLREMDLEKIKDITFE
ncbi:MAG TPA: transposase [Candidatus Paceibacterota bacterium]|nr:transposase [Candidatus Paceibacterota bacterium]